MSTNRFFMIGIAVAICLVVGAAEPTFDYRHPRPSPGLEGDVAGSPAELDFRPVSELAGVVYDVVATFPKGTPAFEVQGVSVNGIDHDEFLVWNGGVLNGNRRVHGAEDWKVAAYCGWNPGRQYHVLVTGTLAAAEAIDAGVSATAPETRQQVRSTRMATPSAEFPYHHASVTIAKEALAPGTVSAVTLDGKRCRDCRYFNSGLQDPAKAEGTAGLEGETYTGQVDGSRDFQVVVPCNWTNGSSHTLAVTVELESGETMAFEGKASAPGQGGYWNEAWPNSISIVLSETAGLPREGEPVHLMLGLFADDLTDANAEVRVLTYDPRSPKAADDGYVVAPCQITAIEEWRDEAMLAAEERDAETGELVKRYDPTTTVELVFLADVLPYQEKVYQVLYGNPDAAPLAYETDLEVSGEGYAQTIATEFYEFGLAANSGAVETVKVLGEGDPILLEHKLETNGAVHWNPGCYTPPTPWVHVSDWEGPDAAYITGPLMHRTRRYALLPHMKNVAAHVSYTFYAGQPYVLMSSFMEVFEDIYAKALRNAEIVLNHAVLDEFVWKDPLGKVQSLDIETSRRHPIHALEIPPDTEWMAFISRDHKVGFAAVSLAYENTNRFGDPTCEAQPYIYVQNGPWIYWSRPIVYPFGTNNLTRLMRVRKGNINYEKYAWLPFRLADGNNPFEQVERLQKQLTNPLLVHEWAATDDRTPENWIMPILTMPFDEGVEGGVSAFKPGEGEQE